MITPFGRFRWERLSFGLLVSSEIFQKRLTDALDGLKGVICVADDITVVGDVESLKPRQKRTTLKTLVASSTDAKKRTSS